MLMFNFFKKGGPFESGGGKKGLEEKRQALLKKLEEAEVAGDLDLSSEKELLESIQAERFGDDVENDKINKLFESLAKAEEAGDKELVEAIRADLKGEL